MKVMTNILISVLSFAFSYGIAHLTGSVIVKNAVLLAYVIHWIAYIPAYMFQTEKFYDLTGSVTYLSVVWFVFLSTYKSISLNFGNLILVLLISIWTIRLGLFLFMRIHKAGEDKRFRSIKTSASQFFMTFTLSGLWVTLCSMCALVAISSPEGLVMNALTYVGIILFIIGFGIEIVADNQKQPLDLLNPIKIALLLLDYGQSQDILIILEKCCYGLQLQLFLFHHLKGFNLSH